MFWGVLMLFLYVAVEGEEGNSTVSGVCSRHYIWLNIKWILCKQVITKEEETEWGERREKGGVVKIAGTVTEG